MLRAVVDVGWLPPGNQPTSTTKTANVVLPEDERLTPETRTRLRHNKVIVIVKV
jgi:hypothetical protein